MRKFIVFFFMLFASLTPAFASASLEPEVELEIEDLFFWASGSDDSTTDTAFLFLKDFEIPKECTTYLGLDFASIEMECLPENETLVFTKENTEIKIKKLKISLIYTIQDSTYIGELITNIDYEQNNQAFRLKDKHEWQSKEKIDLTERPVFGLYSDTPNAFYFSFQLLKP